MAQTQLSPSPFQTTIWQPGHSYSPGDVVQPTTVTNTGVSPPTNADFTSNLTGWTVTGAFTWDGATTFHVGDGTGSAKLAAAAGPAQVMINSNEVAVTPGQVINAYCWAGQGVQTSGADIACACTISWYNAAHGLISTTIGAEIVPVAFIALPGWLQATVTGTAPAAAAFAKIGTTCRNNSAQVFYVDAFYWDYQIPSTAIPSYFTDIGTTVATSGPLEPDWTNGGSNVGNVIDGGITWARGLQSIIIWNTGQFCKSSNTQPTWPITPGFSVNDGSGSTASPFFAWKTQTPQIQDTNCPQSKYVTILSSKIFAGDTDIVRYSATTNPMDWTTTSDAGFLPTGLQVNGANPVSGMGAYRSNLAVFNSQGMQIWQPDEDPANMSLLTAIPVGCSYPKTITPVNDDLFFLSGQGVRTVGISAASSNLMAGDVGMPIDSLVLAGVAACIAAGTEPIACYYPSTGQFWIHFPGWQASGLFFNTPATTSNVFVCTMNKRGDVLGAWSRYNFPFPTIDAFAMLGDALYLRSGDDVLAVDPSALTDYTGDTYLGGNRQVAFAGCIEWPYIDFGQPGTSKFLGGIDVIGKQTTSVTVSIGYNQADHTLFTTPFTMPGDSLPGLGVPMALQAPSFAPRLTFTSTDAWEVEAVILYVDDAGAGI